MGFAVMRVKSIKENMIFELLPVCFLSILNFEYVEKSEKLKFRRDVCLKEQDGDIF